MTEFSKVTQADRDAAAGLPACMFVDCEAHELSGGERDGHPLVQAFARHRIAALSELETKLRMIVSHATGGETSDTSLSVNDICVRISQNRNHVYAAGQEKARGGLDEAIEALEQWKCPSCGGRKVYLNQGYDGAGDWRSEEVPCKVCGESGLHPIARTLTDKLKG